MSDFLYHYCDRLTAGDIVRSGKIQAVPQTLHRDAWGRDEGRQTPPLIWLTTNSTLQGTAFSKMLAACWPKNMVGHLCRRVVLPGDYPNVVDFKTFMNSLDIPSEWWAIVVKTAAMAGNDYDTWRIARSDIPASDFVRVETFLGYDEAGMPQWRIRRNPWSPFNSGRGPRSWLTAP